MSISWSVDRRHIGTIIRSVDCRCIGAISIVIAGVAALSVCRLIVGVSARLVVYSGRRHIGTRAYIGAGAVYKWSLFLGLGRVRQGPISVLTKTLF